MFVHFSYWEHSIYSFFTIPESQTQPETSTTPHNSEQDNTTSKEASNTISSNTTSVVSFDPSKFTAITAGLSNTYIKKIPEEKARELLQQYATSRGSQAPQNFFTNLPSKQLTSQMRSARDMLSKIASKSTTKKLPGIRYPWLKNKKNIYEVLIPPH